MGERATPLPSPEMQKAKKEKNPAGSCEKKA